MNQSALLKGFRTVSLLSLALSSASQAAILIGRENFNYANGVITDQAGGTGWNYDRASNSNTGAGASDWEGAGTVTNGALVTTSTAGTQSFREFSGITEGLTAGTGEYNGAFRGTGTFLFGVDVTYSSVSSWGGISFYDGTTEKLFFGIDTNTKFIVGGSATTTTTVTGITPTAGQTYRLVGQVDYDADTLKFWINPTTQTSTLSTANVTITNFTNSNWTSRFRLGGGVNITWDNLEFATPSTGESDATQAFALVIPEPSSISLLGAFGILGLLRRRRN